MKFIKPQTYRQAVVFEAVRFIAIAVFISFVGNVAHEMLDNAASR